MDWRRIALSKEGVFRLAIRLPVRRSSRHVPEIQTWHPDVTLDFDSDPDACAAMRRRILDGDRGPLVNRGHARPFRRLRPCHSVG